MEIANNLVLPTLSAADSPSQLSEGNSQAKNAKKKGVAGEESFDASLNATLASSLSGATTVVPGEGAANPSLTKALGKETVELSKEGAVAAKAALAKAAQAAETQANAAQAAKAGGAPAPTIASLFQAKAEQNANGTMAGAFVAGPDQPWNSRWVFGAGNHPTLEDMNAAQTPGGKPTIQNTEVNLEQLKKLVASAQGGDETKLKQAAEGALSSMDSAIAALGGEIESVRTDLAPAAPKGQLGALGGAEYLSALQGAKAVSMGAAGQGTLGGQMNQDGSSTGEQNALLAKPAAMKVAGLGKPDLQVIPGGLSSPGQLEGGLRLSKDEEASLMGGPKADTLVPAGVPLSAALRQDSSGAIPPQVITGHVVPGSMQRDRLTSESLRNMSNGIQGMSASGGGEMRIRLNPGNLGELMIRVSTNGKDVGLKVQATDNAAKKVIEESLGSLRESLAQQSLALGRVDVTLATTQTQNADLGSNSQGSNPNAFAAHDGQNGSQSRFQGAFNGGEEGSSSAGNRGVERTVSHGATARIASMGSAGARAASSSRLDVIA